MKKSILAAMLAAGACLGVVAQADEIQFTTLPETVQTTVIRETHIASSTGSCGSFMTRLESTPSLSEGLKATELSL